MSNKIIKRSIFYALVVCLSFVLFSCSRHTPDTNGRDNYSLTSMTSQDIITGNKCIKRGSSKVKKGTSVDIDVKKFSGVETLHKFQLNGASLEINLAAQVKSGNLKILLCNDSEVIKEFVVNKGQQSVTLPSMSDTLYLKAGGESASYSLSFDYKVHMAQGIMI